MTISRDVCGAEPRFGFARSAAGQVGALRTGSGAAARRDHRCDGTLGRFEDPSRAAEALRPASQLYRLSRFQRYAIARYRSNENVIGQEANGVMIGIWYSPPRRARPSMNVASFGAFRTCSPWLAFQRCLFTTCVQRRGHFDCAGRQHQGHQ